MTAVTAANACRRLAALVEEVAESHEPVVIVGDHHNAVLISQEDWESLCETLAISAIPGAVEAIKEGMATPASEMSEVIEW